ncbi:hypothetical protein J2Y45_006763 [Dyadobacter sp. BE34]|uniref:Uncharacterized protein n=1 Tax=Dyadobacter fermentans TaxID=94254 RepID=A0ABU1R8G3_9BACT|nr:hypothetical protein [Dyadobacter fermentans]MDR7047364.1 hypothetical protein [Dyadobacter sp. BE242]MDR7201599.1 hypothetical protein [Dyadobacter sp. BE34]MDR7219469.1 hypothetical protein [Dyadobacter sp. BE31]MDR7267136.1 hypothetical protein [Dyadobacter sp. BE32]
MMINPTDISHLPQLIAQFLDRAGKDPYLGTSHIAVYVVILTSWFMQGKATPLKAYNQQIMKSAKIASSSTYTKLIKDLCDGGYLRFVPSFYSRLPSQIFVLLNVNPVLLG